MKTEDEGYFRSPRFAGVALRVVGYPRVWEPYTTFVADEETGEEVEVETDEGEFTTDPDGPRVLVRMVGDDHNFEVERDELHALKRSEFCGGCGQIGCGCDPYDGDE